MARTGPDVLQGTLVPADSEGALARADARLGRVGEDPSDLPAMRWW
jgi:hypothetical protein